MSFPVLIKSDPDLSSTMRAALDTTKQLNTLFENHLENIMGFCCTTESETGKQIICLSDDLELLEVNILSSLRTFRDMSRDRGPDSVRDYLGKLSRDIARICNGTIDLPEHHLLAEKAKHPSHSIPSQQLRKLSRRRKQD